ncbi:hypothetical protein C7974DRAFT_403406 [Boeremia exigua]|uniref:uncharacterized protein n=1 Tax=Boeremia exigua TaxID=749465 RepID=UPI001E8E0A2C|nr:uncharacterized protein C7974DRAFT_403406 [Boeremia exigua]KAH6615167.1 hypothetical protein C7974DRAFT_403406 [Boeremia exigua]
MVVDTVVLWCCLAGAVVPPGAIPSSPAPSKTRFPRLPAPPRGFGLGGGGEGRGVNASQLPRSLCSLHSAQ